MRAVVTLLALYVHSFGMADEEPLKEPLLMPWMTSRPASAPSKLLVIIPTFGPPEAYSDVAQQIQASSSSRLMVGILRCACKLPPPNQYLCDPEFEIFKLIPDVIARANSSFEGSLQPVDVFIGGHSVGGASARRFVDIGYKNAGGVFTLGTQYNGDNDKMLGYLGYPTDLKAYPRPFLGLTGELDMMPTSHLAIMIKHWQSLSGDERLQKYPAILAGLDEGSYLNVPYIVPRDLVAEVDRKTAHQAIGRVLGAWLDFVSGTSADAPKQVLLETLKTTQPIAQPFLDGMKADATWCVGAQRQVPGIPSDADISIRHVGFSKLDSCHTSVEVTQDGKLQLSLCDYSAYTYGHRPPWNPTYAGAQDISCKMISKDKFAKLLKLPAPDMTTPAVKNFCQAINEAAFAKAKEIVGNSWPKALERFAAHGKSMVFQNDTQTSIGPMWLAEGLKLKESAKEIDISGVALISTIKSMIYPGNHYCKLLSPSSAVEIIMTMGLKNHVGSSIGDERQHTGSIVV